MTTEAAPERVTHTDHRLVDVSRIAPNDWNPNGIDDFTRRKITESLETFGFVEPITAVERDDGTMLILNGEHRWQVAKDLGFTSVPVTVLGREADISPARQRELTLILNELRGQHDPTRTAALIQEIQTLVLPDETIVLPYSDLVVADLLETWSEPAAPLTTVPEKRTPASIRRTNDAQAPWQHLVFTLPPDAAAVVRQALDAARDDGAGDDDWQGLLAICADYLAGPHDTEESV